MIRFAVGENINNSNCTVGFARLDITPPQGVRRAGYFTRRVADKTGMNAAQLRNIKNGFVAPAPEDRLNFGERSFVAADENGEHTAPNGKDMALRHGGLHR